MASVAASARRDKDKSPGKYCAVHRCLYMTGGRLYCPKHAKELLLDSYGIERAPGLETPRSICG